MGRAATAVKFMIVRFELKATGRGGLPLSRRIVLATRRKESQQLAALSLDA